jgi:hypothetical protein
MRLRILLAALAAACLWAPARAQQPPQFAPDDTDQGWLAGHAVQIGLETLSGDDSRFQWDFDIGAEVDLLRAGAGRVNLLVNYESVLGEQLQRFDPIFNNYTIDVLGGFTRKSVEWALRFHHVSRHLGDRPKNYGIAWNMLGAQVSWRRTRGPVDTQVRGWILGEVARYSVDYDAELGADAIIRRSLSPRWSLVGRGTAQAFLIDDQRSARGTQVGGRLEGAMRLTGSGAAGELYVAIDRRIDADPLENLPVTWALVGLRFLSD